MNATQERLTQTMRHGYAVYTANEILFSWAMTLDLARQIPGAAFAMNVQNQARVDFAKSPEPVSDIYRSYEKLTCHFCPAPAVYKVESKDSFVPETMETCLNHAYQAFS